MEDHLVSDRMEASGVARGGGGGGCGPPRAALLWGGTVKGRLLFRLVMLVTYYHGNVVVHSRYWCNCDYTGAIAIVIQLIIVYQ